ncbi:helix-turn-helix transcriptional regulator [uncultured Actinomyces sp.]|uniref:response regulator transcription factor n=1 Tax=uncultured Actinomyces sp. TaxID=249061 RepID=UPI0025FDCAA3|nr:helix-turn-helix transcriptional regulator [uncultured Actinomyces sp.]
MTFALRSVSTPWPRLSRQRRGSAGELEVIAAAAEGLTTEEIANRLYISVSTVKAHLRSAQERVGARNRVHLAVLAERAGLLG